MSTRASAEDSVPVAIDCLDPAFRVEFDAYFGRPPLVLPLRLDFSSTLKVKKHLAKLLQAPIDSLTLTRTGNDLNDADRMEAFSTVVMQAFSELEEEEDEEC